MDKKWSLCSEELICDLKYEGINNGLVGGKREIKKTHLESPECEWNAETSPPTKF